MSRFPGIFMRFVPSGSRVLNWVALTNSGQSALDMILGRGLDVAVLDLLHKGSYSDACAICLNT